MNREKMLEAAVKARKHAYAPYSDFKVGAAVVSAGSGSIYGGCNVENASYGATICAERGAVMQMVASEGKTRIAEILVSTDANHPAVPCALCLQVLSEFCSADTPVHIANLEVVVKSISFGELLPHPFNEIPQI
jgi:homotetrameric cytidine deaminase